MNEQAIEFLNRHGMNPDRIDPESSLTEFFRHMDAGLTGKPISMPMIPTYVTLGQKVPKNVPVLVLDAGGTNLRVGLTTFTENGPEITDVTVGPMPGTRKPLQKSEYLAIMAGKAAPLLDRTDKLGFCFSFPAEITPDMDGIAEGFNKEITVYGDKGMHVCADLCEALQQRGLPAPDYALINDTVAALLGGYGSVNPDSYDGFIGFILGTGINCCYTEQSEDIRKLPNLPSGSNMVINMESACFDAFPRGDFDRSFDARSAMPGDHLYEKMVSGAYFGETATETIRGACSEGLFSETFCRALPAAVTTKDIGLFLALPAEPGILSDLCTDDSDRDMLYTILERLTDRAARMIAINLTAVLIQGDMGRTPLRPACIVVEGSTFHKSEIYQEKIRSYMKKLALETHGRSFRFIAVEQANMMGAAVAALLKASENN